MKIFVKWAALLLGISILAYFAIVLLRVATVMREFGGIPWSWDFLQSNLSALIILPLVGLALILLSVIIFVRQAERKP